MTHRTSLRRRGATTVSLLAALTLVVTAACTAVPSAGAPVDVTQVLDPVVQSGQVPLASGLSQDAIVRGFVGANARADVDPLLAGARAYLTPDAGRLWQRNPTGSGITLISPTFRTGVDPADPTRVTITGTVEGRIAPDGSYVAQLEDEDYEAVWRVEQVDGEWRIASPDPDLVMTVSAFNDAYRLRKVFFLDHTGTVLVPDLRYLPNRASVLSLADSLMGKLLAGPSAQLGVAAGNALGAGTRLLNNVTVSDDGVLEVDLTGVANQEQQRNNALEAQVLYTLASVAQNVRISIDGEVLVTGRTTDNAYGSFDPDRIPTPDQGNTSGPSTSRAYYILDDQIREIDGGLLPGTASRRGIAIETAAMSAASGSLAVVGTRSGEQHMYVGRPLGTPIGPALPALQAKSITPPTFTRSGDEVWAVQNGDTAPEVVRSVYTTGSMPARKQVESSALADLGPVTAMSLSPDGVRVAFVADRKLYIGVIEYSDSPDSPGSRTLATITRLSQVQSELIDAGPVAWWDAQTVLVGAKLATGPETDYRTIWRVSVDGRTREEIPSDNIFRDVSSFSYVAGKPLLAGFTSGGGSQIWRYDAGTSTWTEDDLPGGGWPFYPN